MNEKLLAPPTLKPRTYALICGGLAAAATLILLVTYLTDFRSASEATRDLLAILILYGVAALAYHRMIRLSATIRPERMPLIHWANSFFMMLAIFGTFGMLIYGSVLGGIREQSWMLAMMAGFSLVQFGWGRRVGESRHCPRCEYEFGFTDDADAPIRCPECGTGWLGRLKKGRHIRSRKLMIFGVVFACSALFVLNPVFYLPWLAPRIVTPILFAGLYVAPKGGYTAWGELINRPLDHDWTLVLARKVLSLRREKTWSDGGASEWFEAMMANNQIPADLTDRYYRESLEAHIHAPTRVKPGSSFTVSLRVTHARGGSRDQMGIMFAGYSIDAAPPTVGRSAATLWRHHFSPGVMARKKDVLQASLMAPDATEFQLRAVFWLVHQPSFMDELSWRDDGTPAQPKTALWFERRELVKTIHVKP
ncbi:MAG: hypothetical protein H7210_03465 [Pyrinomonadaceae bacterium]|nr:hypothetical protein [Phycisphaerales bacterium]